ncbi:hypothetical protein E2562_008314 [Oryza meyeriana var. granulata]|uniref:Uncharacterized protein n=1 Tax=Oryza meyeriana var. granulata TaxID=110450 RepID=A0A6G1DG65_9ORYZ|nr:hypothetical protein E2562_008314 [Oryza meyeriana var. granulata]
MMKPPNSRAEIRSAIQNHSCNASLSVDATAACPLAATSSRRRDAAPSPLRLPNTYLLVGCCNDELTNRYASLRHCKYCKLST